MRFTDAGIYPPGAAVSSLQYMRVIDCDCGKTVQAGTDEDLVKAVRAHVDEDHAGQLSDEQVEALVAKRAYEASDA